MDDKKEIRNLFKMHDDALNKVKNPLDFVLKVPFEDCPYFIEKIGKKYGKAWYTIDPDVFFSKVMDNLINYDPLFAKISPVFKKRLQVTMNILFCRENNNHENRFLQNTSKKYPSWAKFWNDFSLSSFIHGEFPWEDINDQIVFKKYNTFTEDNIQANLILGFNFNEEYNKLKEKYPDPEFDKKLNHHKNSINKKVS